MKRTHTWMHTSCWRVKEITKRWCVPETFRPRRVYSSLVYISYRQQYISRKKRLYKWDTDDTNWTFRPLWLLTVMYSIIKQKVKSTLEWPTNFNSLVKLGGGGWWAVTMYVQNKNWGATERARRVAGTWWNLWWRVRTDDSFRTR